MAAFFNKVIRLVFPCSPFTKVCQEKNKVFKKTEKPYFQYVNLSIKLSYMILTLLPYFSSIYNRIKNFTGLRHFLNE
jgi:hypothetical protein